MFSIISFHKSDTDIFTINSNRKLYTLAALFFVAVIYAIILKNVNKKNHRKSHRSLKSICLNTCLLIAGNFCAFL